MYKYLFWVLLISLAGQSSADPLQENNVSTISRSDTAINGSGDTTLTVDDGEIDQEETNDPVASPRIAGKQQRTEAELDELEDQIDDEIDIIEDKIDELEDRIRYLKEVKSDEPHDTIDAEFIINKIKTSTVAFTQGVTKSRAQGYGGGAIIQPMILGLKMEPVNELIRNNNILSQFDFSDIDDGYQLMIVMGGFGYGGVGNGLRIGFGGWGGDFHDEGERKSGVTDSVMTLNVHVGFGGMLVEKAMVNKSMNFILGGMIGAGSIKVRKKLMPEDAYKYLWSNFNREDNQAKAAFAGFETHGGFTATVLSWLHLGMDLNALFSFSVDGFGGAGSPGFMTVNPGARIRIVLGNLG